MKKIYQLTSDGKKELEKELASLVSRRKEVAEKIASARDYGDLSENAEYDAAREEQGLLETRVAEIEDILKNAELIKSTGRKTIGLGSKVELKQGNKKLAYTIVGPVEADPLDGKISNESPIGMALFNKKVDDIIEIETPKGKVKYTIASVA